MDENLLIDEFKSMNWQTWMYRTYDFLAPYLMVKGASRAAYKKVGIDGEYPIIFFDSYYWYHNKESIDSALKQAKIIFEQVDVITLSHRCERVYRSAKKEITKLRGSQADPVELYKEVIEIMSPLNVYVWVAHQADDYFNNTLREKLSQNLKGKALDKFIGDISFPAKKNAYNLMEDDIRQGMDIKELHNNYAWMKARTEAGFGEGYTLTEIKKLQTEVLTKPRERRFVRPIPNNLKKIVKETQESVYLRTFRSDALYELYYLAKPIFKRVEKKLSIDGVQYYLPKDIINQNISKKYTNYALLKYYDDIVLTKPIFKSGTKSIYKLKGTVAWPGQAVGIVKIIHSPNEVKKVKKGDILVTHMTIPAYLVAMNKAAAFVTDEGGITCHAAIIAREMKKPCLINTKTASRIFHDGDKVEVNADKGIVRKI